MGNLFRPFTFLAKGTLKFSPFYNSEFVMLSIQLFGLSAGHNRATTAY
ncbi:hypothetical protein BB2000_3039 [Proteus mirabilis BB2000]|nr:hypothetical protein BB2000_3039 [Proteus mirabilis BB2000]